MKVFVFCFCFLIFSVNSEGQDNPYKGVDSLMQTCHEKIKSVDDLKNVWYFIYQHFYSDSLRLRAAVDWIAENISYDVKGWKTENPKASDVNYVLKSKKAVCGGYASLLNVLCDMLNIECQVVTGTARAFDRDIYLIQSRLIENHAWNMVKVNGSWRLVDPTWIAGHVTGDVDDPKTKYEKEFDGLYYLMTPSKFILNHFPSKSQNQLLSPAFNEKIFRTSPLYFSSFLKDSISEVSPKEALIKATVGDTINFRFKTNKTYLRIVAWSPSQKKAEFFNDAFSENGWIEFKYPVMVSGYYNLYLGYTAFMMGESLLAYKLQVDSKRRQ